MEISRRISCVFLCLALAAAGCGRSPGDQQGARRGKSRLPVYNSKKLLPAWLHEDPIPENDLHHVLDFKLTDQRGKSGDVVLTDAPNQ